MKLWPIQYVLLKDKDELYAEQGFREEVIRYPVRPGTQEGDAFELSGDKAEVVGETETLGEDRNTKIYTIDEYKAMQEEAKELMCKFDELAGERVSVYGDGWCWIYSLSTVLGASMDHKVVESRNESGLIKAPTKYDTGLASDIIQTMRVCD